MHNTHEAGQAYALRRNSLVTSEFISKENKSKSLQCTSRTEFKLKLSLLKKVYEGPIADSKPSRTDKYLQSMKSLLRNESFH